MPLKNTYILPAAADMHVHLRDGAMAQLVAPTLRRAGIDCCFVMPNLSPRPVVSVAEALAYRDRLRAADPGVTYLMSLYLHESVTPDVIREAREAGISGVKAYPRGATTNSEWGVASFEPFYPVLAAMEEEGVVLNLHGEVPSSAAEGVTVMNAEARFMPVLKDLVARFPRLKIVLEHVTSAEAVKALWEIDSELVRGTVTAHHLSLLVDDWAGNVFNFCKPSAKTPEDRRALLQAVVTSNKRLFLGTDSAPHDVSAKKSEGNKNTAAGVFTQPFALGYVLTALEEAIGRGDVQESQVTDEFLAGFLGEWGREFYGVPPSIASVDGMPVPRQIRLIRDTAEIPRSLRADDGSGIEVVPYRAGERTWGVEWLETKPR